VDVIVEERALGDQRVDLLLLDFPTHPVNKQSVLDSVVLTQHRIHLELLPMQDLHKSVDELVHLLDREDVEVLQNEEQFHLVELGRVLQRLDQDVHDFPRNILLLQVSQVDLHTYLVGVVSHADLEQFFKLLLLNLTRIYPQEMRNVVILCVHLKH